MTGFFGKVFGWMRAKPSAKEEPPQAIVAKRSVSDAERSKTEHQTFRQAGRVLAVASARWGSHADRHRDDPYAFSVASEGGFAACLCDGSGDWGEGVAASRIAAREAAEMCAKDGAGAPDALVRALVSAHETVRTFSSDDESGAACSAALVVIRDATVHVGWVGALEVVFIRRGALIHRTTGHLLWREAVASGQLSAQDAIDFPHKNIVTRALGVTKAGEEPEDTIDVAGPWLAEEGDLILLCSKTVYEVLLEPRVLALADSADLEKTVSLLLNAALAGEDYFEACAVAIRVGEAVKTSENYHTS